MSKPRRSFVAFYSFTVRGEFGFYSVRVRLTASGERMRVLGKGRSFLENVLR